MDYCNENIGENLANMQIIANNDDLKITILTGIFDQDIKVSIFDIFRKKKYIGPYLKIMRYTDDRHNITHCCRVSMESPKYIIGFDENMKLNKKEKEYFMSLMISKSNIYNDSYWAHAIDYMNDYIYNKKYLNIKIIPNYFLLEMED